MHDHLNGCRKKHSAKPNFQDKITQQTKKNKPNFTWDSDTSCCRNNSDYELWDGHYISFLLRNRCLLGEIMGVNIHVIGEVGPRGVFDNHGHVNCKL